MQININGKDYELAFGMDFLAYLNKANSIKMEVEGQEMAMGIGGAAMLGSVLGQRMPSTLYQLLKGATAHLKSKPSNDELNGFINSLMDTNVDENGEAYHNFDRYNQFFDELENELKKQPATLIEMGLINPRN